MELPITRTIRKSLFEEPSGTVFYRAFQEARDSDIAAQAMHCGVSAQRVTAVPQHTHRRPPASVKVTSSSQTLPEIRLSNFWDG